MNSKKFSLEKQIMKSLAFFDLFNRALKLDDLKFLWSGHDEEEWDRAVKNLSEFYVIKDDFYCLKESDFDIGAYLEQEKIANRLLKKARKWNFLFNLVPFVRAVYACNLLKMAISGEDSDIDLFIVVRKERIFIAKYLLTFLIHLFGLRRHGAKIRGRFCLSFYVTEESLDLSGILVSNEDLYLYFWLISLEQIYNDGCSKVDFENVLARNRNWLEYFNADAVYNRKKDKGFVRDDKRGYLKKILEWGLNGRLGYYLEEKLKVFSLNKFQSNQKRFGLNANVIVNDKMLKYHNEDRRKYFMNKINEKLNGLGFLQ